MNEDNPDSQHEQRVSIGGTSSTTKTAGSRHQDRTVPRESNKYNTTNNVDRDSSNAKMCYPTDRQKQQQHEPHLEDGPEESRARTAMTYSLPSPPPPLTSNRPTFRRRNQNSLSITEMEQIVATARASSSFQERTLAMEDLHGIVTTAVVPESLLSSSPDPSKQRRRQICLDVMNRKLSIVRTIDERLLQSNNDDTCKLLDDQDLQWSFLEACGASIRIPCSSETTGIPDHHHHIIDDAIDSLIRYVSLQNQITTTSGGEIDQKILQSGCIQLLPQPDQAGRLIVGIFPTLLPHQISLTSLVSLLIIAAVVVLSF